jgi:hypothetical protein
MSERLRPSTLGDILDRTAQLYRRNFMLFAGTAALPVAAMLAVGVAAGVSFGTVTIVFKDETLPDILAGMGLLVALAAILPIYIAAGVFSYAGLTQAAVNTHRGERPTIRGTLTCVAPRFWRYFWFILLQALLVILVPAAIFGAVAAFLFYYASSASLAAAAALSFLGFLVAAAGGFVVVWCALGCSLGFAACVVEQKTAWESLQRSWKLSQGARGRIFVLFLLVLALQLAGSMAGYFISMIALAIPMWLGHGQPFSPVVAVVTSLLQLVVNFSLQVLLTPVSWIALVLFYYDQRIRKEGFDIEWMMEQAGLTQHVVAAPAGVLGLSSPFAPPQSENLPAPAAPLADSAGGISGPVAPPDTVEER